MPAVNNEKPNSGASLVPNLALAILQEVELHIQLDRGKSMWRTLTREALLKRAISNREMFEHFRRQKPDFDFALEGILYANRFQRELERSEINLARCERLGRAAHGRFRRSHPASLAVLGKDLVRWVWWERRLRGER
jgi:hypothetical protein